MRKYSDDGEYYLTKNLDLNYKGITDNNTLQWKLNHVYISV